MWKPTVLKLAKMSWDLAEWLQSPAWQSQSPEFNAQFKKKILLYNDW